MNISLQSKTLASFFQKSQRKILVVWHTFSLTPAQYWKPTLWFFAILITIIIAIDIIIFWQYFITLDRDTPATPTRPITLENEVLGSALNLLHMREKQFTNAKAGVIFRDVFVSPQSPTQQ